MNTFSNEMKYEIIIEYLCWESNNQKYFRGGSNQLHLQEVGPGRLLHAQGLPCIELTGLRLIHMGQLLQGGNFGWCMLLFVNNRDRVCSLECILRGSSGND